MLPFEIFCSRATTSFERMESRLLLAVDVVGALASSTQQLDELNVDAGSEVAAIEIVAAADQTIYYQHVSDDQVEIRFLTTDSETSSELLRTTAEIRLEHAFGSGDDLFLVYTHRIVKNSFPEANYEDGIDVLKGYVVSERRAYTLTDLSLWTNDNMFGNRVRFVDSDDGLVVLHDEFDSDLTHTRFYLTSDGKEVAAIGSETYTALFQNAVDRVVQVDSLVDSAVVFDGLQFDRGSGQQLEGIWTLDTSPSTDPNIAATATKLVTEFETPLNQFEFTPRGPRELTAFGEAAYFVTDDGASGLEIWRTDGTAANTRLLKDIHPTGSSSPIGLMVAGEKLFFFASDGSNEAARQLWATDGTEAGTQIVGSPLLDGSSVVATAELDDRLVLFTEANGSVRLWSADGSPTGTEVFAAFAGSLSVEPVVHEVGDKLLFLFDDGEHGREWWVTDGTKEGTGLAADIQPGEESSLPQKAIVLGTELVFAADDGDGFDIWSIDVSPQDNTDVIPGDANKDLAVNFLDFLILSENFGKSVDNGIESGDFNDDGSVNFQDFLVISENFGQTK